MNGRMVGSYCELREDSRLLEANIEALHRSKCTFFCRVWRQVSEPSLHAHCSWDPSRRCGAK